MKIIRKILIWIVVLFFGSSLLAVLAYRYIPVYITPLMLIRTAEQAKAKESLHLYHHWVPLDEMSPSMPVAVMASEDQRFLLHNGFDFDAIKQAEEHNKEGKTIHGASTISQQTAKNVFLWPARSWVRKGLEAYFTVLIELFWSKHRIMEVYLNSIEMGDGIYGAYAVAEHKFNKTPDKLTRSECALIAISLPNPRKFDVQAPTPYMRKRQRKIEQQMTYIPLFPKKGEKSNSSTISGGAYTK